MRGAKQSPKMEKLLWGKRTSAYFYYGLLGVWGLGLGGGWVEAWIRIFRINIGFNVIKRPILVHSIRFFVLKAPRQHVFAMIWIFQ